MSDPLTLGIGSGIVLALGVTLRTGRRHRARLRDWSEEHWDLVHSAVAVAGALLVSSALAVAFNLLVG